MNPAIRLFYKLAPALSVLFALLAVIAFLQKETGWPLRTDAEISYGSTPKTSGYGIRASIEGSERTPQAETRGVLLRDGEIFGTRVYSNKAVKNHGGGRYNIRGHILWFSTPPGETPPTASEKGPRYSLRVPKRVRGTWPAFFLFGAFGCALAGRRTTFIGRPPSGITGRPAWLYPVLATLAAALVTTAGYRQLKYNPNFSDGGFTVKGVPYSDAQGWDSLARKLDSGQGYNGGFEAQRPFYPMVLGASYTLFGQTLTTARTLNLAILAALTAGTFLLTTRAFGNSTAAATATLFLATSLFHQQILHLQLTEELATMLGIASLAVFWHALVASRRTSAIRPATLTLLLYVAAGLLLGFSNLARPFTLLAAPLLALLAVLCEFRRGEADWRWFGRGIWNAAALTIGTSAVILPWIARQYFVHGITSISDASGTLLYATAKGRHWGGKDVEELIASGAQTIAEKNAFYTAGLKEAIAADPGAYFERILHHFADFPSLGFDLTLPQAVALISFSLLAAAAGAAWRARMLLPGIAVFIILWPLVAGIIQLPVAALLLFASVLGFWRGNRNERLFLSATLATLVGSAVLCAIIGNFGIGRLAALRDLLQIILLANGLRHLAALIADAATYMLGHERLRPPIVIPRYPLPLLPLALLGLCLTACIIIIPKNLRTSPPPSAETLLPAAERAKILTWVLKTFPEVPAEEFEIRPVDLTDHRALIAAGENTGHYANPFAERAYLRTVAMPRDPSLLGPIPTTFADTLPETIPTTGRFALVSIPVTNEDAALGFDPVTREALALYPMEGDAEPLVFPLSPEAKAELE